MPKKYHPFKKGDIITFSNAYGTGHRFGINQKLVDEVRIFHKFLTVNESTFVDGFEYPNSDDIPVIYVKEVQCFWPAHWFKKIDKQLEFNFNAS